MRSKFFLALLIFATIAKAQQAPRDSHIGVDTHFSQHWNVQEVMPLIAKSGVGWIRDDLSWAKFEKQKGVYRVPEMSMGWINAAHAAGLKVDLLFNGSNRIYAPDIYDSGAYARAAAAAARDLAGKVQAIEILNEPANFGFSKFYGGVWNGYEKDGSISPWVKKYVELINKAAKAIRAKNPEIKIIGLGSVAPVNFRQIAMGIVPEVDGIVGHPYSYRTAPELIPYADNPSMLKRDGIATADAKGTFASQIRMYREQSAKYHGPKELWLTEWGWSTFQEAKPGLYSGFTLSAQAKYILRRLAQCLGLGVEETFIYDFKDDGTDPYDTQDRFGLVDYASKPKPSYTAVQRFAALMAKYHPHRSYQVKISPVDDRPDTYPIVWYGAKLASSGKIECYQFDDAEGKPLILLWSSERADGDLNPRLAEVKIGLGASPVKVEAQDLYTGRCYAVPFERSSEGIILKRFTVPDHPIALTFQ